MKRQKRRKGILNFSSTTIIACSKLEYLALLSIPSVLVKYVQTRSEHTQVEFLMEHHARGRLFVLFDLFGILNFSSTTIIACSKLEYLSLLSFPSVLVKYVQARPEHTQVEFLMEHHARGRLFVLLDLFRSSTSRLMDLLEIRYKQMIDPFISDTSR